MRRLFTCVVVSFAFVSMLGAPIQVRAQSNAPTGSIQGTITFEGYPLPRGKVRVHVPVGTPKVAVIDEGVFKLESIPAGSHCVSLDAWNIPKRYADPATSRLSIRVKEGANPIVFALNAEGIEVGEPAPSLMAYGPDGNGVIDEKLRGKLVLLAFWSIEFRGAASEAQFSLLTEIRREFSRTENFQMISLCADAMEGADGAAEAWNKIILELVPSDDGKGKRRLLDDSRWWQCTCIPGVTVLPSAPRYGVTREPQLFLIDPDGRFAAVRIPRNELRQAITKALEGSKKVGSGR